MYGDISPSKICRQGICAPMVSGAGPESTSYGYFASIDAVGSTVSKSVAGVCSPSCTSPGALPNVATYVIERPSVAVPGSPSGNPQVSLTMVINGHVPIPGIAAGAGVSIAKFIQDQAAAERYADNVKKYYETQRKQDEDLANRLRSSVATVEKKASEALIDSFSAINAALSTMPAEVAIKPEAIARVRAYESVRDSPFVTKHNEFDHLAGTRSLQQLRAEISTGRYQEAVRDIDDLYNSNFQSELESAHLPIADGVARFDVVDPQIPTSPFAGTKFVTSQGSPGGQELRRVANRYSAFWASTRGLSNYSAESVANYATGLTMLREADKAFASASGNSEAFGYAYLANTLLDVADGTREGIRESLTDVVNLLPELAHVVGKYSDVIRDDPSQAGPILVQMVVSVPAVGKQILRSFQDGIEIIRSGSAYERSKLISKLATDWIVADITGGLIRGHTVEGVLIVDEEVAKEAQSALSSIHTEIEGAAVAGEPGILDSTAEAAEFVSGPLPENGNKLSHLFKNAGHHFDALLASAGSREAALIAIDNAASNAAMNLAATTGKIFWDIGDELHVDVLGQEVLVRGIIIDGEFRIGTAFVRP